MDEKAIAFAILFLVAVAADVVCLYWWHGSIKLCKEALKGWGDAEKVFTETVKVLTFERDEFKTAVEEVSTGLNKRITEQADEIKRLEGIIRTGRAANQRQAEDIKSLNEQLADARTRAVKAEQELERRTRGQFKPRKPS